MVLRKVTIQDIDLLIKLRIDYLIEDRGHLTDEEQDVICQQLLIYFPKHMNTGEFLGIIAEEDNKVVSAAFLAISEKPANPVFITGKVGTLLNVLTYPEYRQKGYATKVLLFLIEEAKQKGVSSIDLSATNSGKPLYEKLGFHISQYVSMRLKLL